MAVVGIIATTVAGLVVLTAVGLVARSMPDVLRYRRIRRM